ncbi:S1C family serine protease [Peribacillus asahii]|uniref:Peptidase S1 n=1 Tax=Peribacillus asahii TaxID=228899 RepID=A0A3T0KLH5_9BACI|nr:trypsin-like peptidase domain-containing protein [Peribacillus asahii]AZV41222.1 peptidase S1 [Peribacillus asahii]USK85592.1 trypsin-like peptidase domain-containing protein [Peribacillus asahii]
MEPFNEEQVKQQIKVKKEKSPLVTSIISSTVAALITSSVFLFAGDYINNDQKQETDTVTTQTSNANVQKVSTSNVDSDSIADIVENASKSIVGVVNYQESQTKNWFGEPNAQAANGESETVESGTGSGVIWKKENGKAYIITNNHVIEGAAKVEISLYDGTKTKADVVGADALTDLAVLTIDASDAPEGLTFGDSDSVRPGESVLAIGNPLGLDFSRSVTQGIVSAINRTMSVDTSAGEWELNVLQTDAAINPGNSGGALINTSGEVVGINSMKISESGVEGLGFAIPSNDVIPIAEQLVKSGKITRPYLGVSLMNVSDIPQYYRQNVQNSVQSGVIITGIEANSAAAEAGFQQEDIIVAVNGVEVGTATEFRKQLYTEKKIGDKVSFTIYRGNDKKTMTVTLQSKQ